AEQRAERQRQKALEDRNKLFRLWQKWHREELEKLAAGPYGTAVKELASMLATLTLSSGLELIELVRRGPWRAADADIPFQVLRLIDGALAGLRERHGLPPFDDALPGEPATVFELIRMEVNHD